jgi:hypothetical protein
MPQRKPQPAPAAPDAARSPLAAAARLAFKGLDDWIEVFTVGEHTDSKGRTPPSFTAEDLAQMAANVAGAGVPHVIGHPQDEDRAWAWSKPGEVKVEGDALLVKASDVDPEFRKVVDAGGYRERSLSLFKDPVRGWVIQHVGWLGAKPPALVLKPLNYRAAVPEGAEVLTFAAPADAADVGWVMQDVARALRGIRDWLISDQGLEVADRAVSDWTIGAIESSAQRLITSGTQPATPAMPFSRGAVPGANPQQQESTMPGATTVTFTQADLDRAREEARQQTEGQFAAQGRELAELRAERQSERIGVQIATWKAAGLLLPAEEPGLAEFMAALEGGSAAEFTFSAVDKSQVKQTPAQWFAAYVAKRKPIKLGGAGEGSGSDPAPTLDTGDTVAVAQAAQTYQREQLEQGRRISTAQAVMHVTRPIAG